VNEALLQWLMTAPDGPDEQVTLEDFLLRPAWQQDAACRSQGTGAFFSPASVDIDQARLVCHACPVQAPCLQYAFADKRWPASGPGRRSASGERCDGRGWRDVASLPPRCLARWETVSVRVAS
jgi:hypothetical protein